MKKTLVVTTLVSIIGINNVTFAFGLPKINMPNIFGGEKKVEQQEPAPAIDLSQLTDKQDKVLKRLAAALECSAIANIQLNNALGKNNNNLVAAMNLVKENPTKDNCNNLAKELKGNKHTDADFNKLANGTEEQKAALKKAMEQANLYKYASYICYGLAINDASGMIKEAGVNLKTAKNLDDISKLNNIINTGKMANSLYNASQKQFKAYEKSSNKAKQLLNPTEIEIDDEQAKICAQNALDGFGL